MSRSSAWTVLEPQLPASIQITDESSRRAVGITPARIVIWHASLRRGASLGGNGDQSASDEEGFTAPRLRTLDPMTGRPISPLTAAALCVKPRGLMTARQIANVGALKAAAVGVHDDAPFGDTLPRPPPWWNGGEAGHLAGRIDTHVAFVGPCYARPATPTAVRWRASARPHPHRDIRSSSQPRSRARLHGHANQPRWSDGVETDAGVSGTIMRQ
jgi:hypothetical protein